MAFNRRSPERPSVAHVTDLPAAVLLALGAATAFAGAAALQRSAGAAHADLATRGLRGLPMLLGRVARRPRWWWGWAGTVAGFALQAAALRLASVGVVQPLVALQVVVALGVVAWRRGRPPAWSGLLGCLVLCGGAGAVLSLLAGTTLPPPAHLPTALAGALVVVVGAVAGASRLPQPARGPVLGVAAGVCCGVTAVLLDAVVDRFAAPGDLVAGIVALLDDWRSAALAAGVVISTLVGQAALSAGRLPTTLAVVTAVNPAASIVVSACGAGMLPGTPEDAAGLALAVVAMLAGAALVARVAGAPTEETVSAG